MEYDMGIVRRLLLQIEKEPLTNLLDNKGDAEEIRNLHSMMAADMLDVGLHTHDEEKQFFWIYGLTTVGHELVNLIRSGTMWSDVLKFSEENDIPLTVETVKKIAHKIIDDRIARAA